MMNNRLSGGRQGYTLIELVIVMTIIGILFGAGSFVYIQILERSRVNEALSDVQEISQAVMQYYADTGEYPPDTCSGEDPLLTSANLASCNGARVAPAGWRGPYLDTFPQTTPWGGRYDYDFWPPTRNVGNIPGTCASSQPGVFITIRSIDTSETGIGAPSTQAEDFFQARGYDTCLGEDNGVIYYLIKPL